MTKDIVPELLEKIQNEFKNKTAKSDIIKKKILALQNKNVTHKDSNEFAIEVGRILSEALKANITSETLPDEKVYYNIAKRLIEPTLKTNYEIIGDYSRDVQQLLNQKSSISLKSIKPEVNQDRIDGIINKITGYESFEEGKWLLDEPIINFSQSIVDDTIKRNVDFQHKAGLKPKIIRKEVGNCCDWCKEVVGVYVYPDVPEDVYKRHRYCRCTVDYLPGNGKKQDVWSKKWIDVDKDDKIIVRKELNKIPNSTLNRHTLKKLADKNWTPEFKAKAFKFYRETSKDGVEFTDHGVSRALDRALNKKGYTTQDIIKIAKSKPIFIQTEDGRVVHSDGIIHLLRNPNTGDIVSVSDRKKPRKDWVKIDEENGSNNKNAKVKHK